MYIYIPQKICKKNVFQSFQKKASDPVIPITFERCKLREKAHSLKLRANSHLKICLPAPKRKLIIFQSHPFSGGMYPPSIDTQNDAIFEAGRPIILGIYRYARFLGVPWELLVSGRDTWRIIPFSKWLVTMVSKSPK